MDRSIHASAPYQVRICGIHNRVGGFLRNIGGPMKLDPPAVRKSDARLKICHDCRPKSLLVGQGFDAR
jgi:hypothetical protein